MEPLVDCPPQRRRDLQSRKLCRHRRTQVIRDLLPRFSDPAAAHDNITIVKNHSLSWRDCTLLLVEGDQRFAVRGILWLYCCRSSPRTVSTRSVHAHGRAEVVERNPDHLMRTEGLPLMSTA